MRVALEAEDKGTPHVTDPMAHPHDMPSAAEQMPLAHKSMSLFLNAVANRANRSPIHVDYVGLA
ncbi:hypothetical protein ACFW0H_20335 [Pseudomonas sp. CR3202]|uniref:hypothetical protein n=1 Tax=Pseudomonas sp. CR3202 TaxID=3351532 RepID=UPI003BF1FE73